MACGSCGSRARQANWEWEATFRDGSKGRFATKGEARMAVAMSDAQGSTAPMVRAVAKQK
jgi:hypothetical protein